MPHDMRLSAWFFWYVMFLVCVIFPYCVLGQVWYLIVLIPDLCPLPYLKWGYTYSNFHLGRLIVGYLVRKFCLP